MSFNDLPFELHYKICEIAQLEGRTNLILVNRYFYDLALPILYRTVFLPTRRQVISFQYTLFRRPELASHVRHILMCDRNRDDLHVVLPDFIVYWPQTHSERLLRRQRIREWLVERDKELASFRAALRHILALLSNQLLSLTLLHYEHSIRTLKDLLTFDYPTLEELTIRGDYPPLPPNLNLPSLKRLHLAAGDMPNPWASFSALSEGCPNLTHLRITEPLSCILSGSVLAQAFETAFGLAKYDAEAIAMPSERRNDGTFSLPPPPQLPSSLQELRLQPYPPELSAMGTPYPDHTEMIDRLRSLEETTKVFKLVAPNNENYTLPYSFEIARNDWIDRMSGGDGCWGDWF